MTRAHPGRMIVFDDGRGQFGPMTDLRAAFEIRTGVRTTAARLAALWPRTLAGYWVPERLAAVVAARADAPVNVLPEEETLLLVNGRWANPDPEELPQPGEAVIEEGSEHVVVAHLRRADAEYLLASGSLHERTRTRSVPGRRLYRHPWDVLDVLGRTIDHDVHALRMPDAVLARDRAAILGDHPVDVHPTAAIGPHVVIDATNGAVLVDEGATIRPGAVLVGPCAVGRGSIVAEHATIKAATSIGPRCRVGGEVGGTIFQGYANKAHDGHLGDSWVGKWANLGAGTVNSNLLNTYAPVTMRLDPEGPRHRTGRLFMGAVIGDHVKTAIQTRLMTGTSIGTGAMIACTAAPPTTVRRFAWITDEGERTYRAEKFDETMRAVMARRGKAPNEAYLAAVAALRDQP